MLNQCSEELLSSGCVREGTVRCRLSAPSHVPAHVCRIAILFRFNGDAPCHVVHGPDSLYAPADMALSLLWSSGHVSCEVVLRSIMQRSILKRIKLRYTMNNLCTTVQFPYLPWTYQSELVKGQKRRRQICFLIAYNTLGWYLSSFLHRPKKNQLLTRIFMIYC